MKSHLNSCQSKSKLVKRTEPAWFVFVRDGSPPGHMPGIYLETMKTGEELTWIHLNTPSHFPNLFFNRIRAKCFNVAHGIMWASYTYS
jgi:hypothetical protein